MNKSKIKDKKKKKNFVVRFMEWMLEGQKRAAEKGITCNS